MGYKKPEKKSRLKDLEDLIKGIPSEFDIDQLEKLLPELGKPKKEIPKWLKEFLEKNRPDLGKIRPNPDPRGPYKPLPFDPERNPRGPYKPLPFDPERNPKGPYKPLPFDPERNPRGPYKPLPFDREKGIDPEFEFLTEPPEGMEFKPTKTMEFRDYNQNGIEDREEGLYLPRDFQPKTEKEDIPEWLKEARKEYMNRIFKAGGGMMNINRMTAPLGYNQGGISDIEMQKRANYFDLGRDNFMALEEYLLSGLSDRDLGKAGGGMIGYANGGPAGMTQDEFIKAKMIQEDEPEDLSKLSKFDQIISDKFTVDPRFTAKEKIKDVLRTGRDVGKKGLEGIKGLGSKSIDILRQLLGSKAAEAGTYIPDSVLEEMTIDELVREIQLFDIGHFGNPVGSDDISHLRELTDALEKHMGKYK